MSAWFIFASLGFYPRSGSSEYVIGSPLFDEVNITRKGINGKDCQLQIISYNNSKDNVYVEKFLLRGE